MGMAVRADQIAAAIGRQHIIEETIRVVAVCRHLEADPVNPTIAAALFAELLLHVLEEVVIRIPSLGDVLHPSQLALPGNSRRGLSIRLDHTVLDSSRALFSHCYSCTPPPVRRV